MKHSLNVTMLVLTTFLLAQFIGIVIINSYIDAERSAETGKTIFKDLPIGERPPLAENTSFIPMMLVIIIGTIILLLLIKFKLTIIWKLWFLIAVVVALTTAGNVILGKTISFLLALWLGLWKIFRPNVWIHNLTELFIYGGLAAIFAPMFNLWSAVILLILISGYDAYAVWKSKHMIKLAESQAKAKIFAGFLFPYKKDKLILKKQAEMKKLKSASTKTGIIRTAILGGGDIGFPLIFAGVILKEWGLWQSLIIPFGALLGLAVILWKGDRGKFYPAMPFISAGCFLALGIVYLVQLMV